MDLLKQLINSNLIIRYWKLLLLTPLRLRLDDNLRGINLFWKGNFSTTIPSSNAGVFHLQRNHLARKWSGPDSPWWTRQARCWNQKRGQPLSEPEVPIFVCRTLSNGIIKGCMDLLLWAVMLRDVFLRMRPKALPFNNGRFITEDSFIWNQNPTPAIRK